MAIETVLRDQAGGVVQGFGAHKRPGFNIQNQKQREEIRTKDFVFIIK